VPQPVTTYVGLGSNLDGPAAQVTRAFDELAALPDTRLMARSPLYMSPPMGPQDQPDFVNAVAALETGLAPQVLLQMLLAIEVRHGRHRDGSHWGPRSLDLDILLYGDLLLDTPALKLPHPGLHERAFVLYPLADIAPELSVPGLGPVHALLAACVDARIRRLEVEARE
jgi:2-amino-4-hydroxy-6-hydroxymethyldihydropteridine diphosphokinase